jgi:RNA polymerase sigma-70 factor (ECF subfamily)
MYDTGILVSRYADSVIKHGPRNEQELVAEALRDRNAYARIVAFYEEPLRRYVRRILGAEAQAAEDVLQEIFIKAYVNLNDYDARRSFTPWIYRIAHNEAVSHLRRKGARPQTVDGEDSELILARLADGIDLDKQLAAGATAQAMHAALGELAPRYRDVLVLRYLEEKSYDEISDILQLPPGTVATLINRGLKKLRAMFAAPGAAMARGLDR